MSATPLLEDDFGFAIGVIFRAYARAVEAAVTDLPGGPRGYFILAAAVRGEAGSQRFLADRLGVDRTMMTYLLDDLEEAGLVERKPDPADRRSRQIIATSRGEELWTALHAEVDLIDRQLLTVLPEESQTAFREMLYSIARKVSENEQQASANCVAEAKAQKPERVSRRRRARPNI
ncbi:MarR family winged helix-turn-helix transcriptional regulator [Streptomyces sp. NPDC006527]|jgi:DNA-binding MarR family transcriptional regulator|uniref:MarR family winged helix-turn-helix transcriptional regulator n=1 Tax=Streptomyces sp. NPDC006527 TaxID=3364749 RepID=UPI0036C65E49